MSEISVACYHFYHTGNGRGIFTGRHLSRGRPVYFTSNFGVITLAVAIILFGCKRLNAQPGPVRHIPETAFGRREKKKRFFNWFYSRFDLVFDAAKNKYERSVGFLARKKWIVLAGIAVFAATLVILVKTTASSFVPNEDQGVIITSVSLPPASGLERTTVITAKVDSIAKNASLLLTTPSVVAGFNFSRFG